MAIFLSFSGKNLCVRESHGIEINSYNGYAIASAVVTAGHFFFATGVSYILVNNNILAVGLRPTQDSVRASYKRGIPLTNQLHLSSSVCFVGLSLSGVGSDCFGQPNSHITMK